MKKFIVTRQKTSKNICSKEILGKFKTEDEALNKIKNDMDNINCDNIDIFDFSNMTVIIDNYEIIYNWNIEKLILIKFSS